MKILSILTADRNTVEKKKAALSAKALKRNQEKLIDTLEGNKIDAQAVIENLTAGIEKINIDTFCQDLQEAKVSLGVIDAKLRIAQETLEEWFNSEPTKKRAYTKKKE